MCGWDWRRSRQSIILLRPKTGLTWFNCTVTAWFEVTGVCDELDDVSVPLHSSWGCFPVLVLPGSLWLRRRDRGRPPTLHNHYRLLLILLLSPAPAKVKTACWRTRCVSVQCWRGNFSGEYVTLLFMPSVYGFPALCMRIIHDRWTWLRRAVLLTLRTNPQPQRVIH